MRNGARPRRKPTEAAPREAQPAEQQMRLSEEPAASGSEDIVELLVRVPIDVLRRGPIEPLEAAASGDSAEFVGWQPGCPARPGRGFHGARRSR